MSTIRRVAIIGGNRIPFMRSNTAYSEASNMDMLSATLQGLVERFNLHGERLGEVAAGAVMKHSRDFNMAREATLNSGLSLETPAYDVQQACGTGLEAAILVANKIALGQIDAGIAAGTDTASDAPIALNEKFRRMMLDLNKAKTAGERLKILLRFRPSFIVPAIPQNAEPRTGLSMGQHCEIMAKHWQISREAQDELTWHSHQNLLAAYNEGFFDDLISPFNGVARDGIMRDTPLEKLAKLKPAFDKQNGTLTAANSTTLTDGAAAVLLASEEWAAARNLPVLAYLSFSEVAAVDFYSQGEQSEGLLMAPAYAVPRMLKRAGISLQDFDFYEIHEAFAAQALCTLKAWEDADFCQNKLGLEQPLGSIDRSKLNVKGSSVATGHPFAATGPRIIATLAKILEQNGKGRGLISICAAGGQGVTAILER
ncbi:MAG: acetyl-CoA C-acetyltransferase [Porticoccaceae bacterium]|jgi:acetyl-CoA C-acetyltransferase|nr:acetyl-CoA C-acetyltransferase [Alphaproteobacteria bacterium]MDP4745328.1 acetyl-CoA C-acetyltransferase [Porticoccaceae bacterium]MDP4751920.1 acetyl-CoA C-acetyltransferase [Porticoccaceae bacterium]MDP4890915.1 acetyl-CoA C-acetyltransferase [Porticoccaceae bacterium]MDP4987969.1 acetyl-CoA C-acetyltransferase [Porticoccaceae bacterium]